jgi:single-strand DNA-binding protein
MNGLACAFTGRLGGDPELRYSQGGTAMLQFSVAVDENTSATEERAAAETQWVRCTLWGDQATALGDQLTKGCQVYVEGRLRLNRWTSKSGESRSGLNVSAWRCDIHGQLRKTAPVKRVRDTTPVLSPWDELDDNALSAEQAGAGLT